ncbi:MAG: hypothetical protein HPY83_00810 [Anaerolineae bacterium]|nr:hypothetical protein [Anaerolineae bacterium]
MRARTLSLDRPPQSHVEEIMRRQRASLAWQPVDRLPLGIWINRPENRADLVFEDILDYRTFFTLQERILSDTLAVGSDIVPALAINNFGDGILPSMFGADLIVPRPDIDVIQDLGPWVVPLLKSRSDMAALRKPPLDGGLFPTACDAVRYYRDRAPDWLPIVTPMRLGPLSVAMLLRGEAFYTDLYEHPGELHHVLQVCTETFIETEQHLFALAGMSLKDTITNFGVSLEGALRVGEDCIINLRPEFIEEFVVPYYAQIGRAFGGRVLLHFCSMPHTPGGHVVEVLRRHPDVFSGVSTQLGVQHYLAQQDGLRGILGVEAGYGVGISSYRVEYGSFAAWAEHLARRAPLRTGLVLYTEVRTLEEAQTMWQDWLAAS